MKAFLAVARREVFDKRFVFAAATVAGLIPLVVPLVRSMAGRDVRDTREWLAIILGGALAVAVSLAVGATGIAGELASGQMGFYFSRPLSSFQIWGGKLAGGLVLVVGSLAIAVAPTLAVDRELSPIRDLAGTTARGLVIEVALLTLLFLGANAVSTMLRSRAWYALGDLAACAAVLVGTWAAWSPLASALVVGAETWRLAGAGVFLTVAALTLGVAGYRAVARGRTEIRETHRVLSSSLWTLWAFAVAGFLGYSRWVLAAPPSSLAVEFALPVGPDGWLNLEGRARGVWASFLYDTRTGRFARGPGFALPAVSRNGRLAAWVDSDSQKGPWFVRTLRLDDPNAVAQATNIAVASKWLNLVLSPDGDRLALVGTTVSAYEIPSGRSLGSARLSDIPQEHLRGYFSERGILRVLRRHVLQNGILRLNITEFDIARRTITTSGGADLRTSPWSFPTASGKEIVSREDLGHGFVRIGLRDGHTAAPIATLFEGPAHGGVAMAVLSDGFALAHADADAWRLETFTPMGVRKTQTPIALAGPGQLRMGGEWAPDRILFAWWPQSSRGRDESAILEEIDLRQGTIRRLAEGLSPITRWWQEPMINAGSEATKLFFGPHNELIRLDPETGARRVILGGR